MEQEEQSLKDLLNVIETTAQAVESGMKPMKDLQPDIEKALDAGEKLSNLLDIGGVFSDNEDLDELPTSSIAFMCAPYYTAMIRSRTVGEPAVRMEQLKIAKKELCDFLKSVQNYNVMKFSIPWENLGEASSSSESSSSVSRSAETTRQEKLERYKQRKEFEQYSERIRIEHQRNQSDESLLRELYISRLKSCALQAIDEVTSLEEECKILDFMLQRASTGDQSRPQPRPVAPMKPFTIVRNEQQKKVFGLGYPSMPTMTVDDWYQQKFGNNPESIPGSSQANAKKHDHEHTGDGCCSEDDEDTEAADEKRVAKERAWDEYKDDHRRGWGSTHNKG